MPIEVATHTKKSIKVVPNKLFPGLKSACNMRKCEMMTQVLIFVDQRECISISKDLHGEAVYEK